MLKKKNKKGFTLTETALVLMVAMIVGSIAFAQMLKKEEVDKAGFAGKQIKMIGESVNAYISNHYDTLSTLTNATGTSTDLGPRTCTTLNNTCTITVTTLVNEGLLPSSYSGKNVYGSNYNILLRRDGTTPYYQIHGLVTTATPLKTGNTNIRYDLLGDAMLTAGIDSGMTRDSSSMVSGFNGAWSATNINYSNINQLGLLAYEAGYGTYNYSVFLRRDGTLPMTGNLNMGSQDINNAVNITASGATKSGTLEATSTLTVGGTGAFAGKSPSDMPTGWSGVRTQDVVGSGTIAVGTPNGASSTWKTYMNSSGNIWASNNITSASTINAAGRITGGDVYSNSEIYATNWLRTLGAGGVYFQKYGGGLYMADTNTITAYGGKNIQTSAGLYGSYISSSGNMYAAGSLQVNGNITSSSQIVANGRLTTNEYMQINGVAVVGNGCSPNGLQGRESTGGILSCVNGVWAKSGGSTWQACRTCGGQWPYTIANFTLHGDSGVNFNGYGPSCSGAYTNGVSNDGDYMQLCASSHP